MTDFDEALTMIDAAVRRVCLFQSDLQTFLRGGPVAKSVGSLNEEVAKALAIIRRMAPVDVIVHQDLGDLPLLPFHAGQLHQVVINLLQNACFAVGTRRQVTCRTRRQLDSVTIEIEDNGPGAAAADCTRRRAAAPAGTPLLSAGSRPRASARPAGF